MKKGREASGALGERRGPKGLERAWSRQAGTVERGKNPEDGTDGGLATSVPRARRQRSARRRRAPDVVAFTGARTPREADPQGSTTARLFTGPGRTESGRAETQLKALERDKPQEGRRGSSDSRQGSSRNTPWSCKRRGGSAQAKQALLGGIYKALKGKSTSRELGRAVATARSGAA
jgi:hypothetical protein